MADKWRTMDCTDCHSRPTDIYNMPEDVVDFGLSSKKINGAIPGIREDSLKVLTVEYTARDEAKKKIGPALLAQYESDLGHLSVAYRTSLRGLRQL
jgi:hypothetical protein